MSRPRTVTGRLRSGFVLCFSLVLAGCSSDPVVLPLRSSGSSSPSSAPTAGSGPSPLGATVAGQVSAVVETEPVAHDGDAADDPAVWVDPDDPENSVVVATDKKGGLLVYDLTGRQLQFLPVGDVNNVDVRSGVDGVDDGGPVSLAVTGNRSTNTLDVFRIDPDTRRLSDVTASPIAPELEVYGSCLYHSRATGDLYVFVDSKKGEVEQWRLSGDGVGRVEGERVRTLRVSSQTEGCVADDELGSFYLGEEEVGIWKFGAEPDAGDTGQLIVETSADGPLVPQVEGLTLAVLPGGQGYLIASSQGDSSYTVYRRAGDNAYVGTFRLVAANGIDGTEDTDGIDVVTDPLGPSFPAGVFVTQDGKNDDDRQNFKLVPLESIFTD